MFQLARARSLWSPTQVSTTMVWWRVLTRNDCIGKTRPFPRGARGPAGEPLPVGRPLLGRDLGEEARRVEVRTLRLEDPVDGDVADLLLQHEGGLLRASRNRSRRPGSSRGPRPLRPWR